MKYLIFVALLLIITLVVRNRMIDREKISDPATVQEEIPSEKTEEFIKRWLQNDNGTIATYIKNSEQTDEDLVKGRESLAETLGLLMFYALETDDQPLFDTFYQQLNNYFLESDGFINWKIKEDGRSDVVANALVDDIRILHALVLAEENWQEKRYLLTASTISDYINEHNVDEGIYTNFYDKELDYVSSQISLSYIDIQTMEELVARGLLDTDIVKQTAEVLREASLENGFYPKTYDVKKKEYSYSDDVNLVDQAILAYHYAQVGNRSEELLSFIKNEMDKQALIYGMYDAQTKEPTVNYESPAIYGFLILYALEIDEIELAQAIYNRLKEFQVNDKKNEYYGGYSITEGNTHIFDNLIPLLAELEIKGMMETLEKE